MKDSENKPKKLIWVKDMILPDILANLIFFLMIAAVGMMLLSEKPNLLVVYIRMLWLLIPTILFLILRRFSLSIIPMLIGHIVIAALAIYLLQVFEGIVAFWMSAIVICLMLYSMRKKYQKKLASSSMLVVIVAIMLHFALLFVVLMFQHYEMIPFVFSSSLIIICFYLACKQLIDFESSFEHFLTSPTQPGRQIQANNHRVISILTVTMLILIPVSIIIPYDAILAVLEKIAYFITAVLFFLISLIPTFSNEGYSEEIALEDPEPSELSPLINQLINIFQIVLFIVLVITLVFIIWKGIVKLILYLRDNYVDKHMTIKFSENENVTDEIFHLDSQRNRRRKRTHDFGEGEEKRVRRLYYLTIRKAILKGLDFKPSLTPGELRENMRNQFGTDISDLTSSYEELRYGQQQINTKD